MNDKTEYLVFAMDYIYPEGGIRDFLEVKFLSDCEVSQYIKDTLEHTQKDSVQLVIRSTLEFKTYCR